MAESSESVRSPEETKPAKRSGDSPDVRPESPVDDDGADSAALPHGKADDIVIKREVILKADGKPDDVEAPVRESEMATPKKEECADGATESTEQQPEPRPESAGLPKKEQSQDVKPTTPVAMETEQSERDVVADDVAAEKAMDVSADKPQSTKATAGEGGKQSQDPSRRSRSYSSGSSSSSSSNSSSSSSSSTGSTSNSHSRRADTTNSPSGRDNGSSSNSDSEGRSSAKKAKLAERRMKEARDVRIDEPARESPARRLSSNGVEGATGPELEASVKDPLEKEVKSPLTSLSTPAASHRESAATEKKHQVIGVKSEVQDSDEVEDRKGPLLLPPPPPPPPPAPATPLSLPTLPTLSPKPQSKPPTARPIEPDTPKAMGKPPAVAPLIEKPDSARLTADLQSCQRQLAEVRSKYDVTRKELHATKRKLKRLTVRMSGGGAAGGAAPSVGGSSSPHVLHLATGTNDEDRNRKWREPMILAAMKIKTAMGIQTYKSLIKEGELLLPSLRTITRYLESLRKSGQGATAAALVATGVQPTPAKAASQAMEVDEMPEEEDDDDDDEADEDDVESVRPDVVANRPPGPTGGVRRKQAKVNGAGPRRTVDHNRNEQRPADVQLADIKTEQDPVSFTASPDINYYQHNADDDDDEDDDGFQDPTSLLEGCRYGTGDGMHLSGEDGSDQYGQPGQQQQTLSQAQIEFLKSMVGFRKKWTPYELRTCNDIRRIIGSREYDSLRKNDGMPLPSVKTLRKYRFAAHVPDGVDVMGRKRKLNELEDSPPDQPNRTVARYSAGEAESGDRGTRVLFPFGNDSDKELLKPMHDPDGGHFDVSVLTLPQIRFLQTLTLNTKGFSDYELQRSLELKNELGSANYEMLRRQEFLNIPTLAMLTRYEQDNGLEDLPRVGSSRSTAAERDERTLRQEEAAVAELAQNQAERQNRELEEQQAQAQLLQQEQEQTQLELYNRLTRADPTRHPLFDSIVGDETTPPPDDATTAAMVSAMVAAAAAGIRHPALKFLNLNSAGGDDSSMGIFENHSIFDKDTPMFDMTKLSPAHVEFLNTLPENPKRWTQEMINSALDIKNEIGTRDYEMLRRQGIPLPAARTLRRHKDIRNRADRVMTEMGEIMPNAGSAVVGGSG